MSQKPQPDSRERLAEAIGQQKSLKICLLHPPHPLHYDGPECGVCKIVREQREEATKEFLALTEDLK